MGMLLLFIAFSISGGLSALGFMLAGANQNPEVLALGLFTFGISGFFLFACYKVSQLRDLLSGATEKQEQLDQLLHHSTSALLVINKDLQVEYLNRLHDSLLRLDPDHGEWLNNPSRWPGIIGEEAHAKIDQALTQGRPWKGELQLSFRDRHEFLKASITPVLNKAGEVDKVIVCCDDLSEHKAMSNRLFIREHYNVLTGLPNRLYVIKDLEKKIEALADTDKHFILLHVDLDRVRYINETLGHSVLDRVFRDTADRLRACVREENLLAHLGSDEFIVVLNEEVCADEATILAEGILERIRKPFHIDNHEINITASIGVSQYPDNGSDAATLMRRAEAAMFDAKNSGGNRFRFYQAGMSGFIERRLEIENLLRHAIERDEFKLHYQPVVDLQTNQLRGVEVLLRWHNNELRNPRPDTFIQIAEETGLIVEIGAWVLERACQQIMEWRRSGLPELSVAVNISARQFIEGDIVERVDQALKRSGLPAHHLELEITEGLLINDAPTIRQGFAALKALGVRISLDDFGTGYASLSYLKRYPFDVLKIDRSFVHDIDESEDSVTLVNAIIAMAHSFKMTVIAEGVENLQQRRILRERQCDMVQGYLYSPPLSAGNFVDWAKRYTDIQQAQHV